MLSPESIMLASTPTGIHRHRITSRSEWMYMREWDVTASVIGAIFREHEYVSQFDLFEQKTGAANAATEESAAMRRGRLLEPVAFQILAEERPEWRISPLDNRYYFRDPRARIGCTPDGVAVDPSRDGWGIVQVKTTDSLMFKRKWKPEEQGGEINVPTWIGLQALTEMRLTGASWAVVALLVAGHGLDIHIVDVPEPEGLWPIVKDEVAAFWDMVDKGRMPDFDYERDAKAVARVFAQDDGSEIDLSKDNRIAEVIAERERLKAIEAEGSAAEKTRKVLDTEIIAKLGHAARARLADGRVIVASTIKRSGFTVAPNTFRQIKIKGERA